MDRHYSAHSLGSAFQTLFQFCRGQVQCLRIHVNKYRFCSRAENRTGGGKEAERRCDYGIAWANTCGGQGQPKAVSAGSAAYGVRGATESGEFALKGNSFVTQNVALGVTCPGDCR